MKNILILFVVLFMPFFSKGQQIVSFNTTYYGDEFPYYELYMSNDTVFLEDYKLNKLNYTSEMFALPGRQKFMVVDSEVFILISDFLLQKNENIEQGDFGMPFREIYYLAFFDYALKKRQIISAFGNNSTKAYAFIKELIIYLEKQEIASSSSVINELKGMLVHLEK